MKPSLAHLLVSHWHLAPGPDAILALSAALYLAAAARVRSRWAWRRTASFLGGLGCVLVALQSGLGAYDDQLLSVHMVQHMLLLLVAPLLLLAGRPVLLALRALPPSGRPAFARALGRLRRLTGPLSCLGAFWAAVLLTHLPAFYGATLQHPALHDLEHGLYVLAGVLLWWPVLDGDPVPGHRLGGLGRLGYIIAAMPPMAIVGAYLDRHASLVYPGYAAPAHGLGVSALIDQAQAGAIMWVAGNVVMAAVGLWAAVSALVAEEHRQAARDAARDREPEPALRAESGMRAEPAPRAEPALRAEPAPPIPGGLAS